MRHNEAEIQRGIALFKLKTYDVVSSKDKHGQTWWHGSTCEGGGAYLRHKLSEDRMTPRHVASELNLKSLLGPAQRAYDLELEKQLNKILP